MKKNSITITYLTKVSFSSLNGSDKDVDNVNPIKKITLNDNSQLPYVSSQAVRRALRNRLEEMGEAISLVTPGDGQNPPKTEGDPKDKIDDDLFGFMDASGDQRTSPIRVEALIALSKYQGDLDFGTNLQSSKAGANPNIFETEIHSGLYRGTILIELDRVGKGIKTKKGYQEEDYIDNTEKERRVLIFIDAFRTLWSSGRQTRFLADISPKFIAAAYMKAKNPIFLESVNIDIDDKVDTEALTSVINDYEKFIENHVFAIQAATLKSNSDKSIKETKDIPNSDVKKKVISLKAGFTEIENWVKDYYKPKS